MQKGALKELTKVKQCLDEMRFYKSLTVERWEENDSLVEIAQKL
jgi:hypothetical protein